VINGISYQTFSSSPNYTTALVITICESFSPEIPTSGVVDLVVGQFRRQMRSLQTISTSISLSYTIAVNSQLTASSLQSQFSESISSGYFASALAANSIVYNISGFSNISSAAVIYLNPSASPSSYPTTSSKKNSQLLRGSLLIVVIVLTVVVACALAVVSLYVVRKEFIKKKRVHIYTA
jgi:uncharacterized membrane protein